MVTTLTHGISSMIDNAEAAIIQSAEITEKTDKSTLLGMVSGKAQTVKVFDFNKTNAFNVKGSGDLTLAVGVSGTVSGSHFSSGFITGGKIIIEQFRYMQDVAKPSEWSYEGEHYPSAS